MNIIPNRSVCMVTGQMENILFGSGWFVQFQLTVRYDTLQNRARKISSLDGEVGSSDKIGGINSQALP